MGEENILNLIYSCTYELKIFTNKISHVSTKKIKLADLLLFSNPSKSCLLNLIDRWIQTDWHLVVFNFTKKLQQTAFDNVWLWCAACDNLWNTYYHLCGAHILSLNENVG